ncbi:serine hydrolase domain-containing protein [Parvularcula lutaonensis]|uniref:Serine hydrolase domain-containing protein n=1 Tax=Parvularcula lutaonensis TaxID=491923 RepID=A0ABV7MEB3_9PROT|nr:serine hydrolase domain-containing protein [Parvularcula lutaonensis]GGY49572.1 penicillin-binding protein 4* [Parvularcula lutaonensis]
MFRKGLGLGALVLTLSACAHEASVAPQGALEDADIGAYFEALRDLGQFNGTVLATKHGEVIHLSAYTLDGEIPPTMPVTIDSQYDLRSVSKLVAKIAVVQLEEDGLLTRQTKVSEFFPSFPRGDEITVQHLMDHTSGLPRELTDPPEDQLALTPGQIVGLAAIEKLEFDPGTGRRYSNVGYQVLYAMIAEAAGVPFVRYAEEEIFDPAGMTMSGGHFYSSRPKPSNYAYGHFLRDGALIAIEEFEREDMRPAHLYATAADLDQLLSYVSREPFLSKLANEDGVIAHAGGTRGKRAYVEANTELGYRMVLLSNYDEVPLSQVVSDMRAILEGKPFEIPEKVFRTAIDLPESTLRRYEGTYSFAELEHLKLVIKFENGALAVYQNGQNNGFLKAESERVFFEDPESNESIEFRPREDGRYDMLLDWQGVRWEGEPVAQ